VVGWLVGWLSSFFSFGADGWWLVVGLGGGQGKYRRDGNGSGGWWVPVVSWVHSIPQFGNRLGGMSLDHV
jgi:hypothetical protein